MSHLDDTRLMELGLGAQLTSNEAAHIGDCEPCGELLRVELELTEALASFPQPEPPVGLVQATCRGFEQAWEARRRRQIVWALLAATVMSMLAAGGLVWLLVDNSAAILAGFAVVLRYGALAAKVGGALLAGVPSLPLVVGLSSAASLIASTWILNRISRLTLAERSGALS